MNISGRVSALERLQLEAGPLVTFGEPTPEQQRAIDEAKRIGRPVVCWPVPPPPIEFDRAERMQSHDDT